MADEWMPTYPGSESAVFMAMAKIILDEGMYDRHYLQNWVNWDDYMKKLHPKDPINFDQFIKRLSEEWSEYTPEFAADKIYDGLTKKNSFEIHFPKELTLTLKFFKLLPSKVYFYLLKKGTKFQKKD